MQSEQMKNYIIAALVIVLVIVGLVWLRDRFTTGTAAAKNAPTLADNQLKNDAGTQNVASGVTTDNNYFLGDEKAAITLIEFSDYQCPFCGRFYQQTLPQIKENYVKTGKVKFVFKDFPLESIHPFAMPAAIAARCAGDQDKFWEYHDKIFENQASLSDANLKQWAKDLKLDTAKFNDCLDKQKYLDAVRKDQQEGSAAGVTGTPAFLIEGKLISGAQPYSVFQQAIDAALAK